MDSVLLTDFLNCALEMPYRNNVNKKQKQLHRRLSAHFFPFLSVFTIQASFVRHSTKYRRQEIPYTYFVTSAFLSCDYYL